MKLRRALLFSLLIGLLAGLGFAPAPAGAERVSVSGTLTLDEEEGELFGAYIEAEDREYLVNGVGTGELRKHAGKAVTATGNVTVNDFGEWMIEVQQFRAAEE
jgi:hypothetical protein